MATNESHPLQSVTLMYRAEALVHLGQSAKAIDLLLGSQNVFTVDKWAKDSSESGSSAEKEDSGLSKRSSYSINLATIYALQGKHEECKKLLHMTAVHLTQLKQPLPFECYMLAAYLELCSKNFSLAVEIIQRKMIPNYESLSSNNSTSSPFL